MQQELVSIHYTIGHQILDLEAELGVSTEPHKETLDRLIEEAGRTIQVKDIYPRKDAVGILSTINSILQKLLLKKFNTRWYYSNRLYQQGNCFG